MTTYTPAELTRIRQLAPGECVQFDFYDSNNLKKSDKMLDIIRTWQNNGALRGGRYLITQDGFKVRVVRL